MVIDLCRWDCNLACTTHNATHGQSTISYPWSKFCFHYFEDGESEQRVAEYNIYLPIVRLHNQMRFGFFICVAISAMRSNINMQSNMFCSPFVWNGLLLAAVIKRRRFH